MARHKGLKKVMPWDEVPRRYLNKWLIVSQWMSDGWDIKWKKLFTLKAMYGVGVVNVQY